MQAFFHLAILTFTKCIVLNSLSFAPLLRFLAKLGSAASNDSGFSADFPQSVAVRDENQSAIDRFVLPRRDRTLSVFSSIR